LQAPVSREKLTRKGMIKKEKPNGKSPSCFLWPVWNKKTGRRHFKDYVPLSSVPGKQKNAEPDRHTTPLAGTCKNRANNGSGRRALSG
jgi:hypothetical protein